MPRVAGNRCLFSGGSSQPARNASMHPLPPRSGCGILFAHRGGNWVGTVLITLGFPVTSRGIDFANLLGNGDGTSQTRVFIGNLGGGNPVNSTASTGVGRNLEQDSRAVKRVQRGSRCYPLCQGRAACIFSGRELISPR